MILVTGATGFLGRNLCKYLVEKGHQLRVLVRSTSNVPFLDKNIEVVTGDICDKESLQYALIGCEQVIHTAAYFRLWGSPELFEKINVLGTQNMLEAALIAKVRRFIHVSTIIVVGPQPPTVEITEETSYNPYPDDHYACTKMKGEQIALSYVQRGLPVIVLRLGALYGPGGHYAFNRLFFEEFLRGWRVQIHQGRHVTFPCYVSDAVVAIEAALTQGQVGQVYNIAGESITHREINETVSRLAGKSSWRINFPASVMIKFVHLLEFIAKFTQQEPFYPPNLVPYVFEDWVVNTNKARRELGIVPLSFKEGARRTLEWYQSVGYEYK
jgi:NAD+-dependent farnesol dehydrogenase